MSSLKILHFVFYRIQYQSVYHLKTIQLCHSHILPFNNALSIEILFSTWINIIGPPESLTDSVIHCTKYSLLLKNDETAMKFSTRISYFIKTLTSIGYSHFYSWIFGKQPIYGIPPWNILNLDTYFFLFLFIND